MKNLRNTAVVLAIAMVGVFVNVKQSFADGIKRIGIIGLDTSHSVKFADIACVTNPR